MTFPPRNDGSFDGGSFFDDDDDSHQQQSAVGHDDPPHSPSPAAEAAVAEAAADDSVAVVASASTGSGENNNGNSGNNGNVDSTFDTSVLTLYDDGAAADFEERIRHYTRMRRERQETTLSELSVKVGRLEAALAAESRRRVAAVRDLEVKMRNEVAQVEERLAAELRDGQSHADERMSVLEQRISHLESRWDTDVSEMRGEIVGQADSLKSSIEELGEKLKSERVAQERRQAELLGQIRQVSDLYESRWTRERQDRLTSSNQLSDRLDAQDLVRDEQLRQFESSVRRELQLLEEELRKETDERQVQDEQIVAGLNRYISQVQKSLSYVSGV